MACVYCNDDPIVSKNCYCRDVMVHGLMKDTPSGPVQLDPNVQQFYSMSYWFPWFTPQQNRLFNKMLKNMMYGLVR